ncbi:MAG TPA: hypothetical protein VFF20_10800 [Pseudogracilibacillus sp.]|nr:hypothetical protein [Pseudogracilibacillus sp.]
MKFKKRYYVSINKQSVTETSIGDADEYEIYATVEEAEALQYLLVENEDADFLEAANSILLHPLGNEDTEDLHAGSDELAHIYRLIYQYGTEATKQKIDSLSLL